jgi:CheY-like chemotaxis protein
MTYRILIAHRSARVRRLLAAGFVNALAKRLSGPVVVDVTNNGGDALDMVANDPDAYDLIVVEAALPGISGSQLLAMARTAGLDTPFIGVPEDDGHFARVARCVADASMLFADEFRLPVVAPPVRAASYAGSRGTRGCTRGLLRSRPPRHASRLHREHA